MLLATDRPQESIFFVLLTSSGIPALSDVSVSDELVAYARFALDICDIVRCLLLGSFGFSSSAITLTRSEETLPTPWVPDNADSS